MTTALEHSDSILRARPGTWLVACEEAVASDEMNGGLATYPPGSRFRVRMVIGDLLMVHGEDAKRLTFFRERLCALEQEARP